ncbi:hypothetical protein LPW26_05870 [Rhodopseudomonas sp. HC1]|uniref:hypothetical protein n=1 Tax=Rhodopseudomonas infernalis TaxID=2897386 RepID=UPI001EE85704|nr:hypothetical protein [Rhodopseudomonas infernalis]MCG6204154.1 hypothetical protein [Rhodopseudomonas infernalis]
MIASIFETPAKPEAKRSGGNAPADSADGPAPHESNDTDREVTAAVELDPAAEADFDQDDMSGEEAESSEAESDDAAPEVAVQHGEMLPPLATGNVATVQIATTEIVEITFSATPEPDAPIALRDDGSEDLDALTRYGPGPLDALRFKWSARRSQDGYYVDETIGTSSQPITSGPFSRAEAIAFIGGRDRRARRRFERLRNEIISGPSERGVEDDDETL